MKKVIIFSLILSFFSFQVFAQDENQEDNQMTDTEIQDGIGGATIGGVLGFVEGIIEHGVRDAVNHLSDMIQNKEPSDEHKSFSSQESYLSDAEWKAGVGAAVGLVAGPE